MVGEINYGIIDPNLPERYAQPFARGEANALARQQAQQVNALNALKLQQTQQQVTDENALRKIYSESGGDISKVASGMRGAGMYEPAMKLEGQITAQQAAQREAKIKQAKEHLDLIKGVAVDIASNPTIENATAKLQFVSDATGQDISKELASLQAIGNNPEAIKQWALSHAVTIDNVMPKFHEISTGGQTQLGTINPMTGMFTQTGAIQKTLSPAERKTLEQGKIPSGYRQTKTGDLEAIPGGPADAKTQRAAEMKAAGATDVDIAISTLRDAYDRLEKGGGITSTKKSALSNIPASLSSSAVGQAAGKLVGSENQSARNDIAMTRPALLAALMKATGMSAKQMDSNAELKLWLATATDPTLDVESNKRALDKIEQKYLGGKKSTGNHPSDIQDLLNKYGG